MAILQGNDIEFTVDSVDLANITSLTLSASKQGIEATLSDSGPWVQYIQGYSTISVSFEGVSDFDTNIEDVFDIYYAGNKVDVTFGNETIQFEGSGILSEFQVTGASDEVSTFSGTITGTGQWQKFAGTQDCLLLLDSGDFILLDETDDMIIITVRR